jgi:predicted CopG family antitoxin
MFTHTHTWLIGVGTKTITITNEAYNALSKQKRVDESFSEVINRLTKKTGNLADCYGAWDMDASEAEALKKSLDTHWHKATESLKEQTSE